MQRLPRKPSLACLLAFVVLASTGFAQKLAWTYEPVPKPDENFVGIDSDDLPNFVANGSLLFITRHYLKAGTSRYGLLWLSAKGAKIAELRFDEGVSVGRILHVTPNTVSFIDSWHLRTYKLVKGNLVQTNAPLYGPDGETLRNYEGTPMNYEIQRREPVRPDPFGFVTRETVPDKGTRIRRYLF